MEKLELDKKEVKAVKDSIAHWKRDIQAKLKKGIKIMEMELEGTAGCVWADDHKEVPCFASKCPLCEFYSKDNCVLCPYYRKYGISCNSLHWWLFIKDPCLKTCNGMIKSLENILK